MDATRFKSGKNIHANDPTRALGAHLRAHHTTLGPGKNLVCGQHGCQKSFTVMNSYLRHIRRKHLNENLHVPVNPQAPDRPMQVDGEDDQDEDDLGEDGQGEVEENYAEIFSINNLKQLALSMIMTLKSTAAVSYTSIEHEISGTNVML